MIVLLKEMEPWKRYLGIILIIAFPIGFKYYQKGEPDRLASSPLYKYAETAVLKNQRVNEFLGYPVILKPVFGELDPNKDMTVTMLAKGNDKNTLVRVNMKPGLDEPRLISIKMRIKDDPSSIKPVLFRGEWEELKI